MNLFKNRSFHVKMIKDDELGQEIDITDQIERSAEIVSDVLETAIEGIVKLVLIYIAADTARHVVIELSKK